MNMNRMIVFGDSILKGVMYLDNGVRGKYKLCQGAFEQRMSERGVEVIRRCHMGATIDAGLEQIKKSLERGESFRNTTVLLEFGGNDCAFNWKDVSDAPEAMHKPKNELARFCELYRRAIALAQSAGAEVMLASLVPIDAVKYMHFISRGLSYDNILSWLGDINMLYRWHEGYNRAVEQLAVEHSLPLLDLRSGFLSDHAFKSLICDDGIHPTQAGHKKIEDIAVGTLSCPGAA